MTNAIHDSFDQIKDYDIIRPGDCMIFYLSIEHLRDASNDRLIRSEAGDLTRTHPDPSQSTVFYQKKKLVFNKCLTHTKYFFLDLFSWSIRSDGYIKDKISYVILIGIHHFIYRNYS